MRPVIGWRSRRGVSMRAFGCVLQEAIDIDQLPLLPIDFVDPVEGRDSDQGPWQDKEIDHFEPNCQILAPERRRHPLIKPAAGGR